MSPENLAGDIVSIIASLIALSFVIGVWRMVHAPSRLMLMIAMIYMVTTRFIILVFATVEGVSWIANHRSLIIVPQYVLFAVAFGMTYYELRRFHFDVPLDAEDTDTQEKHKADMDSQMPTTAEAAVMDGARASSRHSD
jgi:hypothetical protein